MPVILPLLMFMQAYDPEIEAVMRNSRKKKEDAAAAAASAASVQQAAAARSAPDADVTPRAWRPGARRRRGARSAPSCSR